MLKINGTMILNVLDLKNEFRPWSLYENLEEFTAFARVHCLPLISRIGGEEDFSQAVYFSKSLWIEILEKRDHPEFWPDRVAELKQYIIEVVQAESRETKGRTAAGEEKREILEWELKEGKTAEKLDFILKQAKLRKDPESWRTAMILLSLCELAEVDVFAQDFQRWDQKREEAGTEKKDGGLKEIQMFPETEIVTLKTSSQPYCFWYYSGSELPKGQKIKTVRIEADFGENTKEQVRIELYDCSTKERVQTVILEGGEYRDCNITGGKVIKFLPTLSISQNLCLVRELYNVSQLTVRPRDAEKWTLGLDGEAADKITSLAAGEESSQGFLLVCGGKLIASCYKPCENFSVRMSLNMVADRLVEAAIGKNGYRLLTEWGDVFSDDPQWNGKENQISLSKNGRGVFPPKNLPKDLLEIAEDESGQAMAYKKMGEWDIKWQVL